MLSTDELAASIKADYDSIKTEQADFLRNDMHGYTLGRDPLNGYSRPEAAMHAAEMAVVMAAGEEALRAEKKAFIAGQAARAEAQRKAQSEADKDALVRAQTAEASAHAASLVGQQLKTQ